MATAPGWPGQDNNGDWWVFPLTGTIQNQANPVLKQALDVSGWVGFSTQADAKAFAAGNTASKVKAGAGAAESAASAVPDFLSRLTSANLWMRIGEAALGIILIAIGLARITHAVPPATTIAKAAGAAALA
jgi:hypothetical protein